MVSFFGHTSTIIMGKTQYGSSPDVPLSDNDIDLVSSYLFDDIEFFVFCRDTFLALIPENNCIEIKEVNVDFSNDVTMMVKMFSNDNSYRFEYEYKRNTNR